MEEDISRPAELIRIACLEKKRKLQEEEQEIPLPKQVCRGPSCKEPNMIMSNEFVKGGESELESTSSNSFHSNSFMSIDEEAKTDPDCPEITPSEEPSTSSASWASTSPYSSEYKTSIDTSSSDPESSSFKQHYDYTQHQKFASNVDLGFSECEHTEINNYTDKELDDLLYSNGVAPRSNYILSSGRWSVNEGAQQEGKKKMTIDKEFEQHFSMLML